MRDGDTQVDTSVAQDAPRPPPIDDWQALPVRGAAIGAVGAFIGYALPLGIAAAYLLWTRRYVFDVPPWGSACIALALVLLGTLLSWRRYRSVRWKLDADGLAVRRGRLWQRETRVPVTRVQHLDLKHGPIERSFRLSTLVVHTAGTKLHAVALGGLDAADAERLRDRLSRQLEHDDDAL